MRIPIKAGIDDIREAKQIAKRAHARYDFAIEETARAHATCARGLARLGEVEISAYDRDLRRFVVAFRRIKHRQELSEFKGSFDMAGHEVPILETHRVEFGAVDAAKSVVAGAGAGAASGAAAFAAVGAFASASTGTAITTLSGAAAMNATLAWLGGGSLAAGGAGMAGGMAVVGGIVTLPLLVVGGLVFDKKASKALVGAKTFRSQVTRACADADVVGRGLKVIASHAGRLKTLVEDLRDALAAQLPWLEELVTNSTDYREYGHPERERLALTSALAITLRRVIDAPLLAQRAKLDEKAPGALKDGRQALTQITEAARA